MKTLQEKRLEFLNETVGFYTNNPRSVTENGICIYSPSEKSVGCAIGRHIEDKELCYQLDHHRQGGTPATGIRYTFEFLPLKLKEFGKDFLRSVQSLHDNDHCWERKGLSKLGKEVYNKIINNYCEGYEKD